MSETLNDRFSDAPESIRQLLAGSELAAVEIGCSKSDVFRVSRAGRALYLKIQSAGAVPSFEHEAAILDWLRGRLPVPEAIEFFSGKENEYLLMTEVPGLNCVDAMASTDHSQITMLLAEGLRMLHAVEISACPFDERITVKLKNARYNVEHGLVDEDNFDPERLAVMTAAKILDRLESASPTETDLVFNHGDYSLPNIILQGGEVSGFIDLSRAGVADRYNDLAIASRSIRYNLGERYERLFFEAYGLDQVDAEKISYYRMMDELF